MTLVIRCLDCGKRIARRDARKGRCPSCFRSDRRTIHEHPTYRRNAEQVRAAAWNGNPSSCTRCGRAWRRGDVEPTAHHLVSPRDGGGHDHGNLVAVCASCNATIGRPGGGGRGRHGT